MLSDLSNLKQLLKNKSSVQTWACQALGSKRLGNPNDTGFKNHSKYEFASNYLNDLSVERNMYTPIIPVKLGSFFCLKYLFTHCNYLLSTVSEGPAKGRHLLLLKLKWTCVKIMAKLLPQGWRWNHLMVLHFRGFSTWISQLEYRRQLIIAPGLKSKPLYYICIWACMLFNVQLIYNLFF